MLKIFNCRNCKQNFERQDCPSYRKSGATYEYCSLKCSSERRIKKVKVSCIYCTKVIEVWPARAKTRKYCDRNCKNKQMSINNKGTIVNKSGIPWNKGKKGVMPTPWNKGKVYEQIRGEKNPNWKGGGNERHLAMGRIEYKLWRDSVFSRDNYTCQICEQYGGTLHADHIEKWADNEELRYAVDNGRTLCVPCHYYITFKRKMPKDNKWATSRVRRLL